MRHLFQVFLWATFALFLSTIVSDAKDRIWIKDCTVNGKPVKFVFDSGADGIALTSNTVKRLGLKIASPATNRNDVVSTDPSPLDIDGDSFKTTFAVITVPPWERADFDGIMGWEVLNSNIVRIDANDLTLKFLHWRPLRLNGWTCFPIMTNFGVLDVEVPHDDGTKGIITIDTGAPDGLWLAPRLWRRWKSAHPHAPMTLITTLTQRGLSVGEEALADKINIGPLALTDVPIMEADSNLFTDHWGRRQDGLLGLAALRRLDLIADGIHNIAYLQAKTTPPRPFDYNRLGAIFVPTAEHPHQGVAKVVMGSPAYDAGIRNGDILVQVDGIRAISWSSDWLSKFELPAGTRLHCLLERNGTNFETVATLRNILQPNNEEK